MRVRLIPGWEDYGVSRCGHVFSKKSGAWRRLRPGNNGDYLLVTLSKEGKTKSFDVHTLVARVYIGPRPKGHVVNHIDTNKHNNQDTNLEYTTQFRNIEHAKENGLIVVGEQHPAAKVTETIVRHIRELFDSGVYQRDIRKVYPHISWAQLGRIVHRENWRHI